MTNKISLGIAISLIAIACAVTFVVTMTVSLNLYNEKIAGVQQREEINTRIQEIDAFVRNYSLYEIDDDDVKSGIYAGYLDGISDKYSDYFTTDEYYYETMLNKGSLVSIGVEVTYDGGYPKVTTVYENSSAAAAGIEVNDIISAVNGQNVLEIGFERAEELILFGDEGTKTILTVRHNGTETNHSLVRSEFDIVSVKGTLFDNGIVCFTFTTINDITGKQISDFLADCPADEIKGYIFDLRNCESGNYNSVADILAPFVPKMTVANAIYRNKSYQVIAETPGTDAAPLPISIITNEKTGGSAELVAVSLRDSGNARITGTSTMGYGTLQEYRSFNDGTAVKISVAVIEPGNPASAYNEAGVKPEFIVEYTGIIETNPANYAGTYDTQLKKAVEIINSSTGAADSE